MQLPIAGQTVTRVAFDYAVTLLTDGGAELRVQTAFTLAVGDGEAVIDPERAMARAADLVALLHHLIESADTTPDGSLRVVLQGGAVIRVEPHPQYEAWTFAGPGGEKAVADPGGGLTTWGPL